MGTITGVIEHTRYRNAENGWTIALVQPPTGDRVTCVGTILTDSLLGLTFMFEGDWSVHPQYGRQFTFTAARPVRPTGIDGLRKYLAASINGLGEHTADLIVNEFGDRTLKVLDEGDPAVLASIKGLGAKRAADIISQWKDAIQYREVSINLMSLGISASLCVRIIKYYEREKRDAWDVINANPYTLTEMWGVGFKTADAIARKLSFSLTDPRRVKAACIHVLQQAQQAGHCYLEQYELAGKVTDLCALDGKYVATLLDEDVAQGHWRDVMALDGLEEAEGFDEFGGGPRYYLTDLFDAEWNAAVRLRNIGCWPASAPVMPRAALCKRFADQVGYELTDQQLDAVYATTSSYLSVLTGAPGVGKTAALLAVLMLADDMGWSYKLASPTGRAAKRMEELTGCEAQTIHRLLKWSQTGHCFSHDEIDPLDADLIVVDEASMIDVRLMRSLVAAIVPGRTRLLLVGDKDQLPSVGPGNVLHDVIGSGRAVVCELTQIMRQAANSGIVVDSHRINRGERPSMDWPDCTFVAADEADDVVARVRAPALSLSEQGETQVLTPQRIGPMGTRELNKMLQQALNPPHPNKHEIKTGAKEYERIFRVGDRVMQTVNDYERGCFNGEVGEIIAVNVGGREVTIRFATVTATYGSKDLSGVEHGWAVTCHKSQGSEYPHVIIVCHTAHTIMLVRQILYTALTRARTSAVIVGQQRAVDIAVRNNKPACRNTRLKERLLDDNSDFDTEL